MKMFLLNKTENKDSFAVWAINKWNKKLKQFSLKQFCTTSCRKHISAGV